MEEKFIALELVQPDEVHAPTIIAELTMLVLVDADVTNPLALTVNVVIVKVPGELLTVARVVAVPAAPTVLISPVNGPMIPVPVGVVHPPAPFKNSVADPPHEKSGVILPDVAALVIGEVALPTKIPVDGPKVEKTADNAPTDIESKKPKRKYFVLFIR